MAQITRKSWKLEEEKLFCAIKNGNIEAVKQMMENGVNLNAHNYNSFTPLHYAAECGNVEVVEFLLQNGAPLEATNPAGICPVQLALRSHRAACVEIFLKRGAKLSAIDFGINVKMLPEHVADLAYDLVDVDESDSSGFTALHRAVSSDDLRGTRRLIARGAKVNAVTRYTRFSPIHYTKSAAILETLILAGADCNASDFRLLSPLCIMICNDLRMKKLHWREQVYMIDILLEHKADPIVVFLFWRYVVRLKYSWDRMHVLRVILQLCALMDNPGRQSVESSIINWHMSSNISEIFVYYGKCRAELRKMKNTILYDQVTLLDFFMKSRQRQMTSIEDSKSVRAFELIETSIEREFPEYCQMLKHNRVHAAIRLTLLEGARDCISLSTPICSGFHLIRDDIIKHLTYSDILALSYACNYRHDYPVYKVAYERIQSLMGGNIMEEDFKHFLKVMINRSQ